MCRYKYSKILHFNKLHLKKKIQFNFRNSVLVNLHYIKASLIKFAYFVLDDLNICIVTDLKKKNLKDIWIFLLRILSLLIFKICKLITCFFISLITFLPFIYYFGSIDLSEFL